VRRPRAVIAVALALVALALILAACGGGDGEETTTGPPSQAPSGSTTPSPGALPPGIAECLADQGFEIEPAELHSVPPQVLQACFQALHQGGGVP